MGMTAKHGVKVVSLVVDTARQLDYGYLPGAHTVCYIDAHNGQEYPPRDRCVYVNRYLPWARGRVWVCPDCGSVWHGGASKGLWTWEAKGA